MTTAEAIKASVPKMPNQGSMDRVVNAMRSRADGLSEKLVAGKIDSQEFVDRMAMQLERWHTRAVVLGRQRAGDTAPAEADDRTFAEQIVAQQAEFLDHFKTKIDEGGYTLADGSLNEAAISNRARMYAERLTGTANETFSLTSEDDLMYWELGSVKEEHCGACPELASASPYKASELPTYPRECQTPCLVRCNCTLRREDGVSGFKPTE